jgi:hypothetical protein
MVSSNSVKPKENTGKYTSSTAAASSKPGYGMICPAFFSACIVAVPFAAPAPLNGVLFCCALYLLTILISLQTNVLKSGDKPN